MRIAIASLLLCLAGSAIADSQDDSLDHLEYDGEDTLDVDRDLDLFSSDYRNKPGVYEDTVDQTLHAVIMGQTMDQHMHIESETTVKAGPHGGSTLDIETTRIMMDMDVGTGVPFRYDSTEPEKANFPGAEGFGELLEKQYVEMDEQGNLVEAEGPGSDIMQQLKPSMSVEQTSRLLRLLPDYPVRPGDSWDVSTDMGQDLGHYDGTATLQGYKEYKHRDCAIITTEGSLEMDMSKLLGLVGGGASLDGMGLRDSTMTSTIYFDHEMQLVRWTKTNQSTTLTMKNPLGGDDMSIPFVQEIKTSTFLKDEGLADNEQASTPAGVRFIFALMLLSLAWLSARTKTTAINTFSSLRFVR